MKGRRIDTIEEIQEESQQVLNTIPKRDFQGCFEAWQNLTCKVSKLLFTSTVLELLDTPLYEGDPKSKVSIMLGLQGNCSCDC